MTWAEVPLEGLSILSSVRFHNGKFCDQTWEESHHFPLKILNEAFTKMVRLNCFLRSQTVMVKERLDPRFSYIDFPTLSIYTDKAAK